MHPNQWLLTSCVSFRALAHLILWCFFLCLFHIRVCEPSVFVYAVNQQEIPQQYTRWNSIFHWMLNQGTLKCAIPPSPISKWQRNLCSNLAWKKISPSLCRNSWSFFGGCSSNWVFCMFNVFLKIQIDKRYILYLFIVQTPLIQVYKKHLLSCNVIPVLYVYCM